MTPAVVKPWQDAAEAALNAVIGDRLDAAGNPLATPMAFYDRGRALEALPEGTSRWVVLVHGMACTERCWDFEDPAEPDYGRRLEAQLGLTPLYLRYNTGLKIRDNGRALSALLQAALEASPVPIEELTLIGHSLGGLVIRSACHEGRAQPWTARVRRAFYIGSPHLGSPWERLGRAATAVMKAVPDPVVELIGEVADARSEAIKNLGDGDLREDGARLPLDPRFEHYVVAGALAPTLLSRLIGDGLVQVDSAVEAAASEEHVGHFPGLHHMALAHHAEVHEWLAARCGPGAPAAPTAAPTAARTDEDAHRPRVAATLALLSEAVEEGAIAIQRVQEELTSRPYDVIEAVPDLRAPTRLVRAVHFGILRSTYAAIRGANAVFGAAVGTQLDPPVSRSSSRGSAPRK